MNYVTNQQFLLFGLESHAKLERTSTKLNTFYEKRKEFIYRKFFFLQNTCFYPKYIVTLRLESRNLIRRE